MTEVEGLHVEITKKGIMNMRGNAGKLMAVSLVIWWLLWKLA